MGFLVKLGLMEDGLVKLALVNEAQNQKYITSEDFKGYTEMSTVHHVV